jgi:hypothetical protein
MTERKLIFTFSDHPEPSDDELKENPLGVLKADLHSMQKVVEEIRHAIRIYMVTRRDCETHEHDNSRLFELEEHLGHSLARLTETRAHIARANYAFRKFYEETDSEYDLPSISKSIGEA